MGGWAPHHPPHRVPNGGARQMGLLWGWSHRRAHCWLRACRLMRRRHPGAAWCWPPYRSSCRGRAWTQAAAARGPAPPRAIGGGTARGTPLNPRYPSPHRVPQAKGAAHEAVGATGGSCASRAPRSRAPISSGREHACRPAASHDTLPAASAPRAGGRRPTSASPPRGSRPGSTRPTSCVRPSRRRWHAIGAACPAVADDARRAPQTASVPAAGRRRPFGP